jgi:hypothetical protein
MITFINGPWNNKSIEDSGVVTFKMTIAKKWKDGYPAVGYESGHAFYEPNEERILAFWKENVWDGICEKIIK